MKANITIYKDSIFLESQTKPLVLDIRYTGTIQADVSEGNAVSLNNNRMIILLFNFNNKEIMKNLSGNFKITKATIYDKDKVATNVTIKQVNDEIQNINSKWDVSDSKYEDLNHSRKYSNFRKTKLSYTINGVTSIVDGKGKTTRRNNG